MFPTFDIGRQFVHFKLLLCSSIFFKRKQRPLRMLGRGGMVYIDGVKEYYLDTDNMLPKGTPLLIYWQDIQLLDKSAPLDDEEKQKVAFAVKGIIEDRGGKVEVKDRPTNFTPSF